MDLPQQTFLVFQDVFKRFSRHLQDVFVRRLAIMSSRRVCKMSCNYVFKTSWKTKKCYTEDVLKTSPIRLQYVFTKTNVYWETIQSLIYFSAKKSSKKNYYSRQKQGEGLSFLQIFNFI